MPGRVGRSSASYAGAKGRCPKWTASACRHPLCRASHAPSGLRLAVQPPAGHGALQRPGVAVHSGQKRCPGCCLHTPPQNTEAQRTPRRAAATHTEAGRRGSGRPMAALCSQARARDLDRYPAAGHKPWHKPWHHRRGTAAVWAAQGSTGAPRCYSPRWWPDTQLQDTKPSTNQAQQYSAAVRLGGARRESDHTHASHICATPAGTQAPAAKLRCSLSRLRIRRLPRRVI